MCKELEPAQRGIKFNTVCPGNVATPVFDAAPPSDDAMSMEEAVRVILDGVERSESMIIFLEKYRLTYCEAVADPQVMEALMTATADKRRAAY